MTADDLKQRERRAERDAYRIGGLLVNRKPPSAWWAPALDAYKQEAAILQMVPNVDDAAQVLLLDCADAYRTIGERLERLGR